MYDTPEFMAKVLATYGVDYTQPKVLCPFHGDINPSMSVDLAKSRVYCFGCQKSYTAQQFIEAAEPKLDMFQVFKRMAEIEKGVKLQLKPQYIQVNSDIDFEQLRIQAMDYYYNLPTTDWVNGDWTDELDYLTERGFNPSILNKCGAKVNFNTNYSTIFPITDNGHFAGWLCRTINPAIARERKYLYNRGFRRSNCLAGRYTRGHAAILVEGYMDMLKIRQAGAKNVAALLGWKMSQEQHAKLQAEGITQIICALDNDESGDKGRVHLRSLGYKHIIEWPYRKTQKDPGDLSTRELQKVFEYLKIKY